ncbi:hypothetical protein [Xanthovirga aplysinae]|uniref:hypothetical protein n=1 Tax=Xanthovirga aplysinae TaxID=2529853 RepID=UPI0012BD1F0E|nr:hypothetical protein [Xanthovirga aplysinae]MTI31957.1 hypothetical protein [Xanthovirga aplysinae]
MVKVSITYGGKLTQCVVESEPLEQGGEVEFMANGVKLNDTESSDQRFVTVSSVPEMPELVVNNNTNQQLRIRLKINYTKVGSYGGVSATRRIFLDYFPEENNGQAVTQTINPGDSYTIDFGDKVRGGQATFEYILGDWEWTQENVETFEFHIRGLNPSRAEVTSYLQSEGYLDRYWFIVHLLQHESGTFSENEFLNFNRGENFSVNGLKGLPNWGGPRGFGIAQLDNFGQLDQENNNDQQLIETLGVDNLEDGEVVVDEQGRYINHDRYIVASDNEIWNWKENIGTAIQLLDMKVEELTDPQKGSARIRNLHNNIENWNNSHPENLFQGPDDQEEGNFVFSFIESEIDGFIDFNGIFNGTEGTANHIKSFYDAHLIRYYNGGHYIVGNGNSSTGYTWTLDRDSAQSGYYVENICSEDVSGNS